jgi:hypothetical protein
VKTTRISMRSTDPGFVREPANWRVVLNGTEVKDWVTADAEIGVVLVLRRGPVGNVVYEGSRPVTDLLAAMCGSSGGRVSRLFAELRPPISMPDGITTEVLVAGVAFDHAAQPASCSSGLMIARPHSREVLRHVAELREDLRVPELAQCGIAGSRERDGTGASSSSIDGLRHHL